VRGNLAQLKKLEEFEVNKDLDRKRALTKFKKLALTQRGAWLKAEIATGRTHQIRRHLEIIGLQVLGDKKYGRQDFRSDFYRSVSRQMLHASEISFLWKGEKISAKAELPKDFCECCERLLYATT
jgi:23S rRNA-/tRNA-specific pseudouridylate synthase